MYVNYHKHTHYSSITTPDSCTQVKEYFDRMVELNHTTYFTTEHGFGGNIFEPFDIRDTDEKYNKIKICYGVEAYITANPNEKVNDNYHIVILARTDEARKKLNKIISKAYEDRFYYQARISVDDLLTLDKDDVYITTACIGGILKNDYRVYNTKDNTTLYLGWKDKAEKTKNKSKDKNDLRVEKNTSQTDNILIPLHKHFGKSLFLEVQNHNEDEQKNINKKALELSKKLGVKIIHGNDSHYIHPSDSLKRLVYLKGKGISYPVEDTFTLDYPTEEEIKSRYKLQNILSDEEIEEAISNTNILSECEEIQIDREVKMPTIYPELTLKGRMIQLEQIIYDKWEEYKKEVDPWSWSDYEEGIELELEIVRNTNEAVHTADYFLLNYEIAKRAEELGGVLTRTARGSASSFFINYLLGLTGLDRFALDVPIYPTRFLSESRLLETKSLADIDFNINDQEPFLQATREILGENSCYQMLAYGTMQLSESFRNLCRTITNYNEEETSKDPNTSQTAKDMLVRLAETMEVSLDKLRKVTYADYNEIAKDIAEDKDSHSEDKFWGKLINFAKTFIGTIVSTSPSPASFLLVEENIKEELGIIKVGDAYVTPITSNEVENWKYLKDDFLLVKVVDIIDKTFKEIGEEYFKPNKLIEKLDDKAWSLYANGLTATLNQTDSDYARGLVMKYKPRTYQELSAFVAAIRPGFKSLLNNFIERKGYTTGNDQLDELLSDSQHYMIYQESIMKYLMWLGIEEDKTYGIMKKIAKKTLTQEQIEDLHETLEKNWIDKIGSIDGFVETWNIVEDAAKYSFNASHSIAVAIDSLYGAYLKANYPLQYFTVALNSFLGNEKKIVALTEELHHFGIKLSQPTFEKPSNVYSYDLEKKTIYQGIGSIKFISYELGEKLKKICKNNYETFMDLLYDLTWIGANSREIEILIKLGFFENTFKGINKRLAEYELYKEYSKRKSLRKDTTPPWIKDLLPNMRGVIEKEKQYKIENTHLFLIEIAQHVEYKEETLEDKIKYQMETLGYVNIIDSNIDKRFVIVTDLNKKYSPSFNAYCLNNGREVRLKVYKNSNNKGMGYTEKPFEEGDLLYISKFDKRARSQYIDGKWQQIEPVQYEWWAVDYELA